MMELNSCSHVDNKIANVAQCSVVNGDKNLYEEFAGDRVAGDMDLIKACLSCFNFVPRRPRTHRVVVGILTVNPEYNVEIGGSTVVVAQKVLYPSDIRRGQNRLSLPVKIINTDFFEKFVTDTEKETLKRKEHMEDNKLEEAVIQKDGKEESIMVMKEDDKLKSDVVVQVWCFHSEAIIWFALNIQAMSECSVTGKTKDGRDIVA
ncbi:hypothetical protein ACET3Z_001223 [Daucus carota]